LLKSLPNLWIAVLVAAVWVALEWVRGWLITGFGWNSLGVALHAELALIQIAEFTGVGGVSFLLVMGNAIALITILRVLAEIGRIRLRPHFDFSLTVALVVLTFSYGVRVLTRQPETGVKLKVAMVQPNISQQWKFDIGRWSEIYERMARLHELVALTSPDLILWPEASVPGGILADVDTVAFMRERAAAAPAMIVGTDDLNRDAVGEDHNSAALFLAGEKQPQFYDKRQLVPFGEYLPLRPLLGFIAGRLVPGDFKPGLTPGVFTLVHPPMKVAPLICFEDTRGGITREAVQLGAQLLVNLTNDGWFGRTAELDQHLHDAVFRAIENRRPMVRCTNNGVTASVDSFGRVERWLEKFTEGAATRLITVPEATGTTFYTRHGEVFSIACACLVGLAGIVRAASNRHRDVGRAERRGVL
jgi:apolipoprotein N-acyltransferase